MSPLGLLLPLAYSDKCGTSWAGGPLTLIKGNLVSLYCLLHIYGRDGSPTYALVPSVQRK